MTAPPSVRAADRWCWEVRAARPANIFHRPAAVSGVAEVAACLGVAEVATEVSPVEFCQPKCGETCLMSKKR